MQNPTQRFRQSSSIVFKKPGVLSDKLKSLKSSNYHRVNIFDGILHSFHTYQCLQNPVWDFFLFCLDLDLFARIKKDMVFAHSQKSGLSITQDLNKTKKILNTVL